MAESAARFSGLINPIRDLALNWDVDIAHTLEEYLEELEQLRLPAHLLPADTSSSSSLNFAEAALLIQGSTCVYSKKVEHLHQLVFQALELISANKEQQGERKDKNGNIISSAQESESYLWGDDPSYLLLDDVPVLSSDNSHVNGPKDDPLEADIKAKSSRRQSNGGRLSLASDISRSSRTSIVLMNSILHDDHSFGGAGGSLKMASCAINGDGALVFSSGQHSSRRNSLHRMSLETTASLHQLQTSSAADDHPHSSDVLDMDMQPPEEESDGDEGEAGEWEMDVSRREDEEVGRSDSPPLSERGTLEQFNPISLLDPYQPERFSSRAVNTSRRTFKLPSSRTRRSEPEALPSRDPLARLLSATSLRALSAGCKPSRLLRVDDSFRELFLKSAREGRAAGGGSLEQDGKLEEDFAEERPLEFVAAEGDLSDDEEFEYGDHQPFSFHEDEDEDDQSNQHQQLQQEEEAQLARRAEAQLALDEALGVQSGGAVEGLELSRSYSSHSNSFENLCRQHISNFMRGAEEYARETNLSRRVTDWTLRLEPILLEQEARPVFDIHEYSDRALLRVSQRVERQRAEGVSRKSIEQNENKHNVCENDAVEELENDSETVHFSDVVGGESNVEVCRIFLACLQLANLGNISLDGNAPHSHSPTKHTNKNLLGGREVSDFQLHLLNGASNRLNIDEYRAPSAKVDVSSHTL